MNDLNEHKIEFIKQNYPKGTRIRCIEMKDSYHPVPSGSIGIVKHVDDAGTIHVAWENGSSLGLIYNEDIFKKI